MARTVGTVKSISGKAAVKTLNDQLHVLKVGEALHENEMVYALGADSKITLTLEGGRELTLNGYDEILLDKSVFATLEEGEALDVKALQQALADALNPENMEETAAGQETTGEANAGADFAERNDARGNPSSYLTGTENDALGVTFDVTQNENFAPEAFDDSGSAIEEGSGDDYDAPVIASGNVLGNDTDDLLPNPPSDLDVTAVTSNNTSNATNFVGGFFVIEGQYGTLVLNSETGEYTYTVDESNPTVNAMNIGDNIQESFSYIVNDGALEDSAVLTITIAGSNDAPIATGEGGYALNVDSDAALTNISSSPTEGAAVKFIVETQAGETVTFNWQFTAGDYMPFNDFAFVGVDNGNLVLLSNVASVGNFGSSGIQTYSITFSEAGTHTITFGVSDSLDSVADSSLNVSNMSGGNLLSVETLGNVSGSGSTYLLTAAGASVTQLNNFLDTDMVIGDLISSMEGNEADTAVAAEGNVLLNDTDVDNLHEQLSVISVNGESVPQSEGTLTYQGMYGILEMDAKGNFTYTPYDAESESKGAAAVDALNIGDILQETFTYIISDNEEGGAKTDTAVLRVTIQGTNDAPVATADYGTSYEGNESDDAIPAEGNVLGGDYDVDNTNLSVISVNGQNISAEEPLSIAGAFGTLVIASDGSYTYTPYSPESEHENAALVDALNEGETLTESFNYTITDGDKYATSSLNITINGTNDAPIANEDKVEISEDDLQPIWFWHPALTIDALANDTDVDSGDNPSNFNLLSVSVEGGIENGFAWIDQNTDTIKYIPNWWGNQSLNEGDTKNVTLNYTMSDDSGVTSTSTVTITIMGENDFAIIYGDNDGRVVEDWHVTSSGKLYESGHLFVSDVDEGEEKFNTNVVANPNNIGGNLTIDQYGHWTYSIDNSLLQHLNEGAKAYEYFTVKSLDGTDSETIKITITGTNDIATISGDAQGGVTEDVVGAYNKLYDSGKLNVSDVDDGEAKFNTHVTANSHNIGGQLTISQNGSWNYSISNSLVQHLSAGEKAYEYFTVKSLDGTDSETIKITITGTNDIATISGDAQGGVTEDWHVSSSGKLSDSGRLYVSDADDGEAKFSPQVIADAENIGGQLTISQNGTWNYSINNSLVQHLSAGEKAYEYFTVKSVDGSDSEIIKITIIGTNDAPIAQGEAGSTDVIKHTTTLSYDLNAGNDYTSSGVTITPINGTSVDRSGPTMGVTGPSSSSQMINPEQSHLEKVGKHDWKLVVDAEEEGIRFVFSQNIKNAIIDFGNFGDHDTASWAIYNVANQKIAFGTYTNSGNPNDSILYINSIQDFNRIEIINSDDSDSFTIDQVIATGSSVSSVTSGSLLYFSEADLLSNDSDIDHLDTLSITSVSNTSARGAIITMDGDGNILYNPNDALDSITQMTYDTFNYTISDGHGGTDTATVTVALTPVTTTEAYDGQILLIEGDNTIDLSNIAALSNNFTYIDLKNGDTSLINVSPENVDNVSENGTLTINGEAADSIALTGTWSTPVIADGYTTYTASVDSNIITLHVETEIIP